MAGLLTKGMKLSYKASGETYTELTNLQSVPELGNSAPEKIDVTVLSDEVKKSIAGLQDSSQDLSFKFLYEKTQFTSLAALSGTQDWKVTLPDDTACMFSGTPSVKLDGAEVNNAISYTLNISVESVISFA